MSDTSKQELSLLQSAGLLTSLVGLVVVVAFCWQEHDMIFSLLALAGAVGGWLCGVLLVPLTTGEEKKFNQVAKVISSFVSGYLLSKVDPLITALLAVDANGHSMIADGAIAENFLITLCSFGVALFTVFSARAYFAKSGEIGKADVERKKIAATAAAGAPVVP